MKKYIIFSVFVVFCMVGLTNPAPAAVDPSVSPKVEQQPEAGSSSQSKSGSSSQPKATVEKTVSGVVYGKNSDGTEEVLLGATVSINGVKSGSYGKNITVSTDPDGKFTLSGFDKNATDLTVSYIGFKDAVYKMSPSKLSETGLRIVLEGSTEQLGEVIVVACDGLSLNKLHAKTAAAINDTCVPITCADGYVLVDANNNLATQPATCNAQEFKTCKAGFKCVVSGAQNAKPITKLEPGVVNGVSIPGALPTKPGDLKIERPNLKPTEQPTNLAGCFEVVDAWNYWVYFEHAKNTLSDACRAHVEKELNKLLGVQDAATIGCINMVGYADATNASGSFDNGKLSLDRANYVHKLVPANLQSMVKPRGGGDVTALANDGRGTANAKERSVHVFIGSCPIVQPVVQGNTETQVTVNVNVSQNVVTEEQLRAESRVKIIAAGKVLNSISEQFKTSVWKNKEGGFNTARLASDSIAGVVLGTAGGLITSNIIKKNQIKGGFEDIKCTIGGQVVSEFGDDFQVGIGLR
ncbi:MAG: carboxypeptidase-like regulatory domain-containing protein [Alphaproteobacteria bacterium]|nr:carboxypeptidase-like regulatory domain-containing protein [Alphaproteobacteria bacterium]